MYKNSEKVIFLFYLNKQEEAFSFCNTYQFATKFASYNRVFWLFRPSASVTFEFGASKIPSCLECSITPHPKEVLGICFLCKKEKDF